MKRSLIVAAASFSLVSSAARAALAQDPVEAAPPAAPSAAVASASDTTEDVHNGILFRAELGLGYLTASEGPATFNGLTGFAGVALGGAINNFVVAAHLYDAVVVNPSISVSGGASQTSSATVTAFGIGPEFGYYFPQTNLYLSVTPALTTLSVSNNGQSVDAGVGYGGRLAFGGEAKVGDHWGLGVLGGLSYASNNDTTGQAIHTVAFSVSFSATYNSFRGD
jgi:hypothetical protein